MSVLHLHVECAPTNRPADEIAQMRKIADLLGITVGTVLNDVFVAVSPGDDLAPIIAKYGRDKERRAPRKFHSINSASAAAPGARTAAEASPVDRNCRSSRPAADNAPTAGEATHFTGGSDAG